MHRPYPTIALSTLVIALLALTAGCGTVGSSRKKEGVGTETEARAVTPQDPLARPIQVGWTSARATYCGFVFDPSQLRAQYLASEQAAGVQPEQMQKIERAYDYTRTSVYDTIKDDPGYCNKGRTAAIRKDLNRYLSGDYAPSARLAR